MRLLLALACVLMLAGFPGCNNVRPTAPVFDAPPMCRIACTPSLTDTGIRWEGNPEDPSTWDVLGEDVSKQAASKLLTCEARRQACQGAIDDLLKRGVIRAKE